MSLSDSDLRDHAGTAYVIYPTAPRSLTPLGYDLRIGAALVQTEGPQSSWLKCATLIEVPPGRSAILVSEEFVWLSPLVAGTIHARGSLSLRGLWLNATTVDPNFDGRMIFRVFNNATDPLTLRIGDAFATLIFQWLKTATAARPNSAPRDYIDDVLPAEAATHARSYLTGSQADESAFREATYAAQGRLRLGYRFSAVRFLSRYAVPIGLVLVAAVIALGLQYQWSLLVSAGPTVLLFLTVYSRSISWLKKARSQFLTGSATDKDRLQAAKQQSNRVKVTGSA